MARKGIAQRFRPWALLAATGLLSTLSVRAQEAPDDEETSAEVIIRSDLPRCHQRRGDPLDLVDVGSAAFVQSVIKADPSTGAWRVMRDDDPITGPDIWQRAGKGIGDFRFRAPADKLPMCIGSRGRVPRGWGQFRRVLDARPLVGRYARFTARVATRRSTEVRFWLAVGDRRGVIQGGDTSGQPLWGTRQWVPVDLTVGPIPRTGIKLSYGFLLMGAGDLWVLEPKLEILDSATATPRRQRLDRH